MKDDNHFKQWLHFMASRFYNDLQCSLVGNWFSPGMECPFTISALASLTSHINQKKCKVSFFSFFLPSSLPVTKSSSGISMHLCDAPPQKKNLVVAFFSPPSPPSPLISQPLLQTTLTHAMLFPCPKYITMHLTKPPFMLFFESWVSVWAAHGSLRSHFLVQRGEKEEGRRKKRGGTYTECVWAILPSHVKYCDLSSVSMEML